MTVKIGRNRNTNDEAKLADVTLNAATSTLICAANPERIAVHVNNNSETQGAWIKLQASGVDNDHKGIWLPKKTNGGGNWDMSPDNIYTGEISAIADSGAPDVYVTEY